ncbi:hypothetical protein [Streptomyces sp. NPDC088719]|uniref:hypothetical protein n=1 Tax=Streptomyces sp. NPDC088719 TaxID=3365872 RepID=UPI00380BEBE6
MVEHVRERLVPGEEWVDEHAALAVPAIEEALVLELTDRAGDHGLADVEALGDVGLPDPDDAAGLLPGLEDVEDVTRAVGLSRAFGRTSEAPGLRKPGIGLSLIALASSRSG